jgi:hypothetical protein
VEAYLHYDGASAATLREHYNSLELAKYLVSGGDMSTLGASCSAPEGHSFSTPVDGYTVYYRRDRGESGCGPRSTHMLAFRLRTEISYLFKDGEWQVFYERR